MSAWWRGFWVSAVSAHGKRKRPQTKQCPGKHVRSWSVNRSPVFIMLIVTCKAIIKTAAQCQISFYAESFTAEHPNKKTKIKRSSILISSLNSHLCTKRTKNSWQQPFQSPPFVASLRSWCLSEAYLISAGRIGGSLFPCFSHETRFPVLRAGRATESVPVHLARQTWV